MHRANVICGQIAPQQTNAASKALKKPMKIVVTGAAGNIAYSILFQIGAGEMLGPNQPIELRLLDLPSMVGKLKGVEMELLDCAFPLLTKVVCTGDYEVAFKDVDIAILIGAKPRGAGMQRSDLLVDNGKIFAGQGQALNKFASRNVKVCVVGNPANTNALIASHYAPNIPKENFTALTRLDQNRAVAQVSLKTGVPIEKVKNVIIWGNHSKTQYPDINHATAIVGNRTLPLRSVINDEKWVQSEFLPTVQDRGAAILEARKLSSAASAANAAIDHVRDWFLGTPENTIVSMAVMSDGSYGIPKGLIFSFPVVTTNGRYSIVQGLKIDAWSRSKLDATTKELLEEKQLALGSNAK